MVSQVQTWIEHSTGVCGGQARIRDTRIPVWTLVAFQQKGLTDEGILHNYPGLVQADLDEAWRYYQAHADEIDQAIADNNSLT